MNDDQFLFRLRKDPPPALAARIRAQLRLGARRRPLGIGAVLGLLLVGGAVLALLSPSLRQQLGLRSPASSSMLQSHVRPEPRPDEQLPRMPGMPSAKAGSVRESASSVPLAATQELASPDPVPATGVSAPNTEPTGSAPTESVCAQLNAGSSRRAEARITSRSDPFQPSGSPERSPATLAVDTRQGLFKVLDWASHPLADMLCDGRHFDAKLAILSAQRIEVIASIIDEAFQLNTTGSGIPSGASPDIWRNFNRFAAKVGDLRSANSALAMAARVGDEAGSLAAMEKVLESCRSCHDSYRRPVSNTAGPPGTTRN